MKRILGFITGITLFFLASITASAEEIKEMTVPLTKGYKEIVFYFEFSDGQEHEIYITKPDGEIVSNIVSTESVSVSIEDATKGDYHIEIIAEEEIKVKARVECKNNTAAEGNNLTVTSALTGLKVYFVNGDLAVSWNDTGAGDVNIKVTNPQTMQILADVKVSETKCLIPIDSTVKKIEVYIVPASSSKVSGAGIGYTLDVVRGINVEVSLPTYTITNQSFIEIPIKAEEKVKVYSVTNKIQGDVEEYEPGEHVYSIPIVANVNHIYFYVEDERGNINYCTFDMQQDVIAPSISLNEQYDGYVTEDEHIVLAGYARDAVSLFINNKEIEIQQSEKFEYDYTLEQGDNSISICAYDEAGNQSIITLTVSRQEAKRNFTGIIVVFFLFIVFAAAFAVFMRRKNKGITVQKDVHTKEQLPKKKIKKEKNGKAENLPNRTKESKIKVERNKERSRRMRERKFITEVIVSCVQLGLLAVVLLFVVRNTIVASGSMEPTLMTNDIVIYNKLSYVFHSVERGDIINFWSEEYGEFFSKRVIGIAGDQIEFHDGYTFINGQRCDESAYIAEGIETNCLKTFVVPEGTVFVMGDNRENSIDSRFFENPYIPIEDIEGKYLGTIPWIFD